MIHCARTIFFLRQFCFLRWVSRTVWEVEGKRHRLINSWSLRRTGCWVLAFAKQILSGSTDPKAKILKQILQNPPPLNSQTCWFTISLKVSYSLSTNMANIIKHHNQKILNEFNKAVVTPRKRKCRNSDLYPLDCECRTSKVTYTKPLLQPHLNSRTLTVLSKHIWELKDSNKSYNLN